MAFAACAFAQAQSLPSTGVRAVPTYESVGLYWTAPGATSATGCNVSYRKAGDSAWSTGMALWYDPASAECRGSLVGLVPGTNYEAQLGIGGTFLRGIAFTTWANTKPVAKVVPVPGGGGTYNITEGGSAAGYVVYDGGGATRDAANGAQYNITVNASYVIVRNLVLKGAQQDAIRISRDVHDVVIEDNDISGWGRTRDGGTWGTDMDSAVRAQCSNQELTRVTVQRNKMHDPRYSANSWTHGHPAGPQGITFSYCGGNHVFRWNEIYSTTGKRFNDGMGGEDNFSTNGFPNSDSDIYGNRITHTWDDGIESEGANKNVRIWGNYMDRTATGIATTATTIGPVYIFRNVFNRNQFYDGRASDSDERQPFFKSGSSASFGNGRRYLFHNTMLQATQSGSTYPLGGGAAVGGTGSAQMVRNTVSMNNIWHVWKPGNATYQVGTDNQFQSDMYNGAMGTAVTSGLKATPQYASGNGWQSEAGGLYQLASGTPGHDAGVRIPNFNDAFAGNAPDIGAAESGASAMKFGLAASTASSGGSAAPPAAPPATPPPAAPPATPGPKVSPSLGVQSTSYSLAAGGSVTLTVIVTGNNGTPSGSVNFTANDVAIPGCMAVALSGGKAACTTTALGGGANRIRGQYSGDAAYGTGTAGPITVNVSGTALMAAALNVQGLWWGSSTESGWGVNLTQQGDIVFATWFTYDAAGKGQWLVMSNGARTGTHSFSGALYRTTGPSYSEAAFDKSRVQASAVGTATFTFTDSGNGVFSATVNGVTVTKAITRQVFDAAVPTCVAGGPAGAAPNYQDLWWRTGGSESGWGVNITHQGNVMFVTWFTYDTDGSQLWLVGSSVTRAADGSYNGRLYRTTGPAFSSASWNAGAVGATDVGAVRLTFSDANNGVFSYNVNGVSGSKPISRQVFSTPATVCR